MPKKPSLANLLTLVNLAPVMKFIEFQRESGIKKKPPIYNPGLKTTLLHIFWKTFGPAQEKSRQTSNSY